MSRTKWIVLPLVVCALGVMAVSRSPSRSPSRVAPAAAPAAALVATPAAAARSARSVSPAAQAKLTSVQAAPFTAAELLARLGHAKAIAQQPQPAEPEADSAEETRAQAAMKQGIEAQSPSVQRIYYRAQINAAPQVRALYQQQLDTLRQSGGSAQAIAAAQVRLDETVANLEKYRAELARLDR